MLGLLGVPLLLQVVVPVGLLLWLVFARPSGYTAWLLAVALVAGYVRLIAVAGLWLMLPPLLSTAYVVVLVVGGAVSLRRVQARTWAPSGARAVVGVVVRGAALALVAALLLHANRARRPPAGEIVDLAFPLHNGTYLVVNGGSVELLNAHLATLERERARPYRGQSHGVDLVRVTGQGRRARGILPDDPAAYAIFGDTVVAPCTGRVVAAEDGHPDMSPPLPDRAHMAGNHILLTCGTATVLIAHLQRGSVSVIAGDVVSVGDLLGRVGNSGNSGEPHLHIHAQRPAPAIMRLGGEPLPIRLDGRYLVRNDQVTSSAAARRSP